MAAEPYDWRKTLWKAVKTGGVAALAAILLAPNFTPDVLAIVPVEYRATAALLLPALVSAARNWLKNTSSV